MTYNVFGGTLNPTQAVNGNRQQLEEELLAFIFQLIQEGCGLKVGLFNVCFTLL